MATGAEGFKEQRIALVERILAARVAGDFDYLQSMSAPDIVVTLMGDRSIIPNCGVFHGVAEAREALERVFIEFSFHDMKITHIMVDGEQVGLRWKGILRNRGTGASGQFEGFAHLIFQGGKIREYFSLVDTAAMSRLSHSD
ncbi:MAG: nuclear transport factor 2 family protein [Beijerinckiaceae bacterium]